MSSDELHSSLGHVEGGAAVSLGLGARGGAVDGEDRPAAFLRAASCCGGHVVRSLLPGAQQPVGNQPLPGPTEVRPAGVRAGGAIVAPPDGVAGGEDSDSIIPKRRSHRKD